MIKLRNTQTGFFLSCLCIGLMAAVLILQLRIVAEKREQLVTLQRELQQIHITDARPSDSNQSTAKAIQPGLPELLSNLSRDLSDLKFENRSINCDPMSMADGIKSTAVNVQAAGTMNALFEFVTRIEQYQQLVHIRDVRIRRDSEVGRSNLQFTIRIDAYAIADTMEGR
jgi:Tfp pilus assembly protein PilO